MIRRAVGSRKRRTQVYAGLKKKIIQWFVILHPLTVNLGLLKKVRRVKNVIPAKVGIPSFQGLMDSGSRPE